MCDFVHLHNHTHYSLQDGACTVQDLVNATVENNMKSIALTDHGVMYGVSEFYKKTTKAGIKPILGIETYINMNGSRFQKGEEGVGRKRSKHYNHLVLLAKNKTGYNNLMKLSTIGFTEGFYYKPRIDLEILEKYREGLICTTACLAGPVSAPLLNGNVELAKKNTILLKEIFDDDLYLEIQDHGMENDKIILEYTPKISEELNVPLVATNDIHYINKDHAVAHNILLLLSDKKGNADYKDLRYKTDQVYFKSSNEMKEIFKDYKGAIENTCAISEKVDVDLSFQHFHYPVFPIPEESGAKNLDEYFTLLAREGLQKKFPKLTSEIEDRFNFEIGVITQMGYSGYFLIVQDFINAAKKMKIPVGPGRGSAAGSLVAYTLGITNVNPLPYDLLFERFLNPERKSMPDIDVDFADDQRGDVIDYVKDKYGEDSVSQIITFNRLSSKAVLRDVARVLGIPIPTVNSITKWIPSVFGRVYTIDQALKEVPELKWVSKSDDPQIQELIKYSRILEGMNRNASKHAAGVVITPGEVSDYVPIAKASNSNDYVTQYNMKELDDAGILKMDFLGLRTLTIIRDAIDLIKKTRNVDIEIDDIPLDDAATFELFSQGKTTTVFQFESAPMREYLKKLKPTSIKDLAAMNALYRPGPMKYIDDFIGRKNGQRSFEYIHPALEPILKETYGIIVYQEQVIQIANKIAGMTLAEADILRRAMGKKDMAAMAEQKTKFVKGAALNNVPEKDALAIFTDIDEFANYGFNKSHAVAYSYVAYQTAYLKTHYLPEFLAANLSNEFNNAEKVTSILDDCRKLKVEVLPPNVNYPSTFFSVENNKIIFGMCAIKNVGVSAVQELEKNREKLGRDFENIYDLCSNIDTHIINKRALEGLVLAGAMDTFKNSRAQNFAAIEDALSFGSKIQSSNSKMANSLFGETSEELHVEIPELPAIEPWKKSTALAKEREVLGFYLSDHPLHEYELEYKSFASIHLGESETFKDNEIVRACGVITAVRTRTDKSGRQMAFFSLDDFSGSSECLMFSKVFEQYGKSIFVESTILVKGRVESSGDAIKIHADEIIPLKESRETLTKKLHITLFTSKHKSDIVKKLQALLEKNPGTIPVYLSVRENGSRRDFQIDYQVDISGDLISGLDKLLGKNHIRLLLK